jgi:hypothetical protein
MVSEAGTVRFVELELRPMVPPPNPLSVTVQVLEAPEDSDAGLHVRELIAVTEPITAPVAVIAISLPAGEAPRLLLIVTGTASLPDGVTDRVATTPSEMGVEFKPQATQL